VFIIDHIGEVSSQLVGFGCFGRQGVRFDILSASHNMYLGPRIQKRSLFYLSSIPCLG